MIAGEQLAEVFVKIADTLVADFDVIEFLETVINRAVQMSRASAGGLLLADPHGRLQFMAASSESAKLLELFQLQHHEGPCRDCLNEGVQVVNTDLDQAQERWPDFAPRAVSAGFRSVHAFPLRYQGRVIGAFNLLIDTVGDLEPADTRIIQALADVATIGLLRERAIRGGETLTEQLQSALNSRIIIEQAKGALARTHSVDVDAAFDLIRGYARRTHHRLTDVAQAVVTDPASHPGLTSARSSTSSEGLTITSDN